MIVIDRTRGDHAFVRKAQLADIVFGIIRKAGVVAGFRKIDRFHVGRVGITADLHLIEPVQAPFGNVEILEQLETGQVKLVRACNHRFPFTGGLQRGLGQAEVDVIIIRPDEDLSIPHIDRIFDAFLAWLDQNLLAGRVVSTHQSYFARLVVARGNDQPVILRGKTSPHTEALVVLFVKRHIAFHRRADHMQLGLQRAPFLGRWSVNQRRVIRDPGQPATQIGELVIQQLTRLQILDPCSVAFRSIGVGRIGKETPVLADRCSAKAEILMPLCKLIFINDKHRITASSGFAIVLAILRAFFKLGPIDPVPILLRDSAVVFLDPRLHLFEQRVGQRLLRRHTRFEPGVFSLHIIEHVFVIDRGV